MCYIYAYVQICCELVYFCCHEVPVVRITLKEINPLAVLNIHCCVERQLAAYGSRRKDLEVLDFSELSWLRENEENLREISKYESYFEILERSNNC